MAAVQYEERCVRLAAAGRQPATTAEVVTSNRDVVSLILRRRIRRAVGKAAYLLARELETVLKKSSNLERIFTWDPLLPTPFVLEEMIVHLNVEIGLGLVQASGGVNAVADAWRNARRSCGTLPAGTEDLRSTSHACSRSHVLDHVPSPWDGIDAGVAAPTLHDVLADTHRSAFSIETLLSLASDHLPAAFERLKSRITNLYPAALAETADGVRIQVSGEEAERGVPEQEQKRAAEDAASAIMATDGRRAAATQSMSHIKLPPFTAV